MKLPLRLLLIMLFGSIFISMILNTFVEMILPESAYKINRDLSPIDISLSVPSRPPNKYPQPPANEPATSCTKRECVLPDCSCGKVRIPGNLATLDVPQMVLITFDDAINELNADLYNSLFENRRTNPNGCPIRGTFYVSHEWTDYATIQNLYADGHEIASHTITHRFGDDFSEQEWQDEIDGMRDILAAYGSVRREDIRGMRAPFLSIGGNQMFSMLHKLNFTYDSSIPVYENNPPCWPYTLDYKMFHPCMIPPCPTNSYPGVWEVPMVMWQDLNGDRCSMIDKCDSPLTDDGVYLLLMKNFQRHYRTNRAPFGVFVHSAWFSIEHQRKGFEAFLDSLGQMSDVWIVTTWQVIQWVRDPAPLYKLNKFEPFQCNYSKRPKRCHWPTLCKNLQHFSGMRQMSTCQKCPEKYPWLRSTGAFKSRVT